MSLKSSLKMSGSGVGEGTMVEVGIVVLVGSIWGLGSATGEGVLPQAASSNDKMITTNVKDLISILLKNN